MVTEGEDGDIELPLFDTIEEAEAEAERLGWSGYHVHTLDGEEVYMPCSDHEQIKQITANSMLDKFIEEYGEDENDILQDYELLSEEDTDDENEDDDYEAMLNQGRVDMAKGARTGKGYPNRKSSQDGTNADGQLFRVRYVYSGSQTPEREFCQKMMSARKVYRKEDIKAMSRMAVNPGFGPGGKNTYSIWLYKGGVNCYHKWFRKIYIQKGSRASNNDEVVSTSEARRQGFRPEPNEQQVPVAPIDMPNRGALN